jgi:hypothetical protein
MAFFEETSQYEFTLCKRIDALKGNLSYIFGLKTDIVINPSLSLFIYATADMMQESAKKLELPIAEKNLAMRTAAKYKRKLGNLDIKLEFLSHLKPDKVDFYVFRCPPLTDTTKLLKSATWR